MSTSTCTDFHISWVLDADTKNMLCDEREMCSIIRLQNRTEGFPILNIHTNNKTKANAKTNTKKKVQELIDVLVLFLMLMIETNNNNSVENSIPLKTYAFSPLPSDNSIGLQFMKMIKIKYYFKRCVFDDSPAF